MPTLIPQSGGQKKKKGLSRQSILLSVFTLFLVGGGAYYYLTSLAPQGLPSLVDFQVKRQLPIKKVNWQKVLYENQILKGLHNPLTAPLQVGIVGNQAPFQPPAVPTSPSQ